MVQRFFGLLRPHENGMVLPGVEALVAVIGVFLDLVVGDVSGSMEDMGFETGKSKLVLMRDALNAFLDAKLRAAMDDLVAAIAYSDNATLCAPLLGVMQHTKPLRAAFDQMMRLPHRGTCLAPALALATEQLNQSRSLWPGRFVPRVLVYSDGCDCAKEQGIALAETMKKQGVLIECFGIGNENKTDLDETFLRQVATTDADGVNHYRFLGDPEAIRDTFIQVAQGTLTVE